MPQSSYEDLPLPDLLQQVGTLMPHIRMQAAPRQVKLRHMSQYVAAAEQAATANEAVFGRLYATVRGLCRPRHLVRTPGRLSVVQTILRPRG